MRKFTEGNFTREGSVFVSEASHLGFPPGTPLRDFEVEGFGVFTRVKTVQSGGDVQYWRYANASGFSAQIFND
jgi:hypothetical protein